MKKAITIYDISKEANVSPSTVSRVINGNVKVSYEKTQRVKALIKKYNFQPNAIARGLIKKESNTIGVIIPDIKNPFFSSAFLEIEKAAMNRKYSVILCSSINKKLQSDTEAETHYLNMLLEKQVDGIIFMGGAY